MDEKIKKAHSLCLENRNKLKLTGVVDVGSFDEEAVVAYTEFGCLTVSGNGLHIEELNLESGMLEVKGEIAALIYSNETRKNSGFFKRLFNG